MLKEVDNQCSEFLWGCTELKKKVSLVAWDTTCKPKQPGGLNVKGFKASNIASVGKLIWLIMKKKDILWVKWVSGVYMSNGAGFWSLPPLAD